MPLSDDVIKVFLSLSYKLGTWTSEAWVFTRQGKNCIVGSEGFFSHTSGVALMADLVCWSVHYFGQDGNILISQYLDRFPLNFIQAFMVLRQCILVIFMFP